MDTDDLSNETYKAVLISSEKFNHDLTIQFGVLASHCENDDDYLAKANLLILHWKADLPGTIADIFFDSKPAPAIFDKVLSHIQHQIVEVLKISIEERTFEF